MAYLVLARRYRPQTFSELVGQEHIVSILTNAIKTSRIHHAFLFTGARGTGKTTTARLLAKALNCAEGPTPEPCNKCESCVGITEGRSIDVLEIDGATNTGVDSVRELREDIRFLPSSSRFRVVIIDEVHMLTTSAFNALLKTLEEPPAHVVFILATTEPHKIPATILSRVQRFDFHRVQTDVLASYLMEILEKEGFETTSDAMRIVALEGEGSVRDSLSILDQILAHHIEGAVTADEIKQVLGITDINALIDLADGILRRDAGKALNVLNGVFYQGYDLVNFAKMTVSFFRDLLIVKSVPNPEKLISESESVISVMKEITAAYSASHILHLFEILFTKTDIISRAASPKTAFELAVMELILTEPLVPLQNLFDKLAVLENTAKKAGLFDVKNQNFSNRKQQSVTLPANPVKPAQKSTGQASNHADSGFKLPSSFLSSSDTMQSSEPAGSGVSSAGNKEPASVNPEPVDEEVSSGILSSGSGITEWTELLKSVQKEKSFLGSCLAAARYSDSEENGNLVFHLVFVKGKNDFCVNNIKQKKNELQTLLGKYAGRKVLLDIIEEESELSPSWGTDAPGKGVPMLSPMEKQRRKEVRLKKQAEEEVKSNSIVRELIDKLDSEIIAVKPGKTLFKNSGTDK